jgi:D-alanyl-D-alanine carboxypeptidase
METLIHKAFIKHGQAFIIGIFCLLVAFIGYSEYQLSNLQTKVSNNFASTTVEIGSLRNELASIVAQNNLLNDVVQNQIVKSDSLAGQVEMVNETAQTLDKLSKIPFQLLQKYSKVYFLNEHYKPMDLSSIPSKYTFDKKIDYQLEGQIMPFFEDMMSAADDEGIDLIVVSAYRSFATQSSLKATYQVIYGAGTANQFSADQGYSEHQLGTTVDFSTRNLKGESSTFDNTPAYIWLQNNAYKYGFVLSYPKNNAYYVYEPWHWRFVGVDLAERLHRQKKNFYDLNQSVINNYLGVIFD